MSDVDACLNTKFPIKSQCNVQGDSNSKQILNNPASTRETTSIRETFLD